jgi:hypothetical protein
MSSRVRRFVQDRSLARDLSLFAYCIGKIAEVVEIIDKSVNKLIQLNNGRVILLQQCNEKDLYSLNFLEKAVRSGAIHTTFRNWRLA